MDEPSTGDMVKDLHQDLVRKYNKHAAMVEQYWRRFDQSQRIKCLRAGAADGVLLRHPLDRSLGNVYKFTPEINLRDLTDPRSDYLLDLLKHRATTSLLDQYMTGLHGGPGDHAFIKQMIETRGLRLANPDRNGFTIFWGEEQYGQSMTIMRNKSEVLAGLATAIRANHCVSQELGELILGRQLYTLQVLNIVIEDILDIGSRTRDRKKPKKRSNEPATAVLAKLSIQAPPKNLSLPDLIASAMSQKASLEAYLNLLSSEPAVLTHAVNFCFFSRPELLPDERGRSLPAVYGAVKAAAIWSYIGRLLELLNSQPATEGTYKAIILQEISNVCHMEYSRTQATFKRHVQTATGAKWFKRMSNAYDKAGNARVNMKGNPEVLTRSDPQLHYVLRLCQPETTAAKAAAWMKKLGDLHEAHPSEREKLEERELDSFCDLATITAFIQDLSPVVSMPSLSHKKNQIFVARSQALDAELNELKSQIDLRDFVVPIDNLLEPGVASKTLDLLDHFIIENAGTKMGFLYQDLIDECFAAIEIQYKVLKDQQQIEQKEKTDLTPVLPPVSESREKRVEQRRQKEKTRPSHSSVYEISAPHEEEVVSEEEPPAQILKVRASTVEVFPSLFAKAESHGSVGWTAFVSAMSDVGFSVQPRFGSVYTFCPPETMNASKSLTVHRPHQSKIEGYLILFYAKRLRSLYGWSEHTFEVAA